MLVASAAALPACVPEGAAPGSSLSAPGARGMPVYHGAELAVPHDKTSGPEAGGPAARLVPAALAGAEAARLTLDQLKGRSARELALLLGEPKLLRRDGPAQIWQYAGSGCVLHFFLYRHDEGFRVTYIELRIDDRAQMTTPSCVEIKGEPRAPSRPAPILEEGPLTSASSRTHAY